MVTSLTHIPNGAVWPVSEIMKRKKELAAAGLTWSVVESVPIHESIKQALPDSGQYLENYAASLRHLASCGLQTVCYNFMPLLDWTRTDLKWFLPNGAEAVRFDCVDAAMFDLFILNRPNARADWSAEVLRAAEFRFKTSSKESLKRISGAILMGLPGTVDDLTPAQFQAGLNQYHRIDSIQLRQNLKAFLNHIIPVAEECGIVMAIHPDDPPFSIFGLPRVASTGEDLELLLKLVDSPANGIAFCTGSLGALPQNDLPALFKKFASRIHFLHLRNVRREVDGSFHEAEHLGGSTDMAAVMYEIVEELDRRTEVGGRSLPMRPDHGHRILTDLEREFYPGYSAIGRLKGLAELRGLELGIRHMRALTK